MWLNIYNRKFECTFIRPSSSASVECEIKKLKHSVLNGKGKKYRVDKTVDLIIKYYDGRLRILCPGRSKNIGSHHDENDTCKIHKTGIRNNEDTQHEVNFDGGVVLDEPKTAATHIVGAPIITSVKHLSKSDCAACLNTGPPQDDVGHYCFYCNRPVHALLGCSMPLSSDPEDEGYGWPRICNTCFAEQRAEGETTEANQILRSAEVDADNDSDKSEITFQAPNFSAQCEECLKEENARNLCHCHICQKKIHAVPQCSVVMNSDSLDDMSKQLRICNYCSKGPNVDVHIALKEVENHKGHAVKDLLIDNKTTARRNLYLGESRDKIHDALLYGSNSLKNLPLLK